jgi:hypothetical protein
MGKCKIHWTFKFLTLVASVACFNNEKLRVCGCETRNVLSANLRFRTLTLFPLKQINFIFMSLKKSDHLMVIKILIIKFYPFSTTQELEGSFFLF